MTVTAAATAAASIAMYADYKTKRSGLCDAIAHTNNNKKRKKNNHAEQVREGENERNIVDRRVYQLKTNQHIVQQLCYFQVD